MLKRALVVGLGLVLLSPQAAAGVPRRAPAPPAPDVNITRLGGNQSEAAIAIDPTDPDNVVEFSNRERGVGMILARSTDGGATWDVSPFARDDRFGKACCDPTLSWDAYGNLFMAWLDLEDSGAIPVAISTNGGRRFHMLKVLASEPARPPVRRAGGRGRGGGRGGEAGRRREGAGAEPERLVRRPADDRGGRGIRLAHVEQQRHHAGVGGARVRAGAGREVLQAAGHPEEPELQLRRHRDRARGPGLRGVHEGQGRNASDGHHDPRRHRPGRPRTEGRSRRRRPSRRPTCSSSTRSRHSARARSTPRPVWRGTPIRPARTSAAST